MRIVLAPWEWHVDDVGGSWRRPGGGTGWGLDLRTLAQAGTPVVASGFGIFNDPVGTMQGAYLGDDPLAPLSVGARRALETALGLTADALTGASLGHALAEQVMGELGDPTGLAAKKPLRMNRRGTELRLKGFGTIYRARFDTAHPAYQNTLDIRKHDYTRERTRLLAAMRAKARRHGRDEVEAEARALLTLQMWTDMECEKLGITDETLILPTRFHADGRRPHATTLTETWPTDSTTISSGMDHAWTEENGDLSTASGVIGSVGTASNDTASCNDALSTDDHRHTASYAITTGANPRLVQVAVVYDATAASSQFANAYATLAGRATGDLKGTLNKYVAGAITVLDTEASDPGATGSIVCRAVNGAVTGTAGACPALSATDTDVTGYLQVGLQTRRAGGTAHGDATLDTHTFEDIPATAGAGVNRGLVNGGTNAGINGGLIR